MPSDLRSELKKRDPFEMPEIEAFLNILRTAGELSGELVAVTRPAGLSPAQYNILRILRGASETAPDGLPCGEIADRMVTREPDVTRLIDRLEKAGLVRRQRSESDRRRVFVALTTLGFERLDALDEPIRAMHRRLLGHMTPEELDAVNRLMVRARDFPRESGSSPAPSQNHHPGALIPPGNG